jgi:V/A-type H+-transporting ATPase subunit A
VKVDVGRKILRKSNSVNQMMKVVGEEGTSINEFIDYLKGEFLDAVYLQQNAFDKTDEATQAERQQYIYDFLFEIIEQPFQFADKEQARRFFLELRQTFITWNSISFKSDEFGQKEKEIRSKIRQASFAK